MSKVTELMPPAPKPAPRESFHLGECLLFVGCSSLALYFTLAGLMAVFMMFGAVTGTLSCLALLAAILWLVAGI